MANTRIVGIVNITPDSFSDGGASFTPEAAGQAIRKWIDDGADIIDIGAESTRPGASPLTPAEEWQRLEPVLKTLPLADNVVFSLDTRHAATAKKALDYGIRWINDVTGFADASMVEAVLAADCMLVMMHSLTVPADKNVVLPESVDAVETLIDFAQARIAALAAMGIARERLIFDPGIGFGKTATQSLAILRNIQAFTILGIPLLVGHSRKSFMADLPIDRDAATLVISQYLAMRSVPYLRVHDVAAHRHMLNLLSALQHGR